MILTRLSSVVTRTARPIDALGLAFGAILLLHDQLGPRPDTPGEWTRSRLGAPFPTNGKRQSASSPVTV